MNENPTVQPSPSPQPDPVPPTPPRFPFAIWFVIWLLVVITGTLVTFILPESYASTARIKVERDGPDIPGLLENVSGGYDPYFIQTQLELFSSEQVLGSVVQRLNLNDLWGKKFAGGEKLRTHESLMLLRARLDLRPIRNTSLIEVRAFSENAQEAAAVANAIAQSYRDYRGAARQQTIAAGVAALEAELATTGQAIQAAQAEVQRLRAPAGSGDTAAADAAKAKLTALERLRDILAAKIAAERVDAQLPASRMAEVVDAATPALRPVRPNKPLNIFLSIVIGGTTGLLLATAVYVLQRLAYRSAMNTPRTPLPPRFRAVMHITIALVVGVVVGYNSTGLPSFDRGSYIAIPVVLLLGGAACAFIELVNAGSSVPPSAVKHRTLSRY